MRTIKEHIKDVQKLCKQFGVKSLFVFGSAVENRMKKSSDIDFLVDFNSTDPLVYADNYFDLKFNLRNLFKKDIDLLEAKALKNPFLKVQIDNTKVLVYGQ